MCGIAGILHKQPGSYPIGSALLIMAACLQHRGLDSAGMAVFGEESPLKIQVMLPPGVPVPEPQQVLTLGGGRLYDLCPEWNGFSARLRPAPAHSSVNSIAQDLAIAEDLALVAALETGLPGATVSGLGTAMTVAKAVGVAAGLSMPVGALTGTHGVAHLRLATESKIDPAHAQPFWGRPFPDIAVTHNGHITNYFKMRQKFEAQGFGFASHNDSEIIGLYLGQKMASGHTFTEALTAAGQELDGSYSLIAATPGGLGVVRDPFATKPLLYAETETLVALASEPQALHRLLGEEIVIREIKPREVRTWAKV